MLHLKKNTKNWLILVFILGLLFSTIIPNTVRSQDFSQISVLLLNGKADNEHSINLKGPTGIEIYTSDKTPFLYTTKGEENVTVQFAGYHLVLLETVNLSEVKDLLSRVDILKEIRLTPGVEIIEKSNRTYYRVTVGNFSTTDQLENVQKLIQDKLNITGKPLGDLFWSLGEFTDSNEADVQVKQLRNKGFNAYPVNVYVNGVWENQVWVGESYNSSESQKLKNTIESEVKNIKLVKTPDNPYVIEKENGLITGDKIFKNSLFVFSPSALITVKPLADESSILIRERKYQGQSNQYRGELNILLYNNNLSIVNKLSLEMYLYSVVGSEMYQEWPLESLKAQAVTARTFAYSKKLYPRNKIADIYDTTDDQAYYGSTKETENIWTAVNQTKGLVILRNGQPISSFYSSNSGGMTSHGSEVWGNDIPFTSVKESSYDEKAVENYFLWYQIVLKNGQTGYVRSDLIDITSKTHKLGFQYGVLNDEPVNFRTGPSIYRFPSISTLSKGEEVIIIETVYENNPYSWIAGPLSADYITENVNKYQLDTAKDFTMPILDLKVANRGPSGRVTLLADGNTPIPVKYPDYYRNLLGGVNVGVQSTLFEIEQAGRIEVLGAGGKTASLVNQKEKIYVQSAGSVTPLTYTNNSQDEYFIMNISNNIKIKTKDQSYIFHGKGFGHGLGMSQWGAKGLAEAGYSYQEILKYYYNDIVIKSIY